MSRRRMHRKLAYRDVKWCGAGVMRTEVPGYGKYRFYADYQLDSDVTLGLLPDGPDVYLKENGKIDNS